MEMPSMDEDIALARTPSTCVRRCVLVAVAVSCGLALIAVLTPKTVTFVEQRGLDQIHDVNYFQQKATAAAPTVVAPTYTQPWIEYTCTQKTSSDTVTTHCAPACFPGHAEVQVE